MRLRHQPERALSRWFQQRVGAVRGRLVLGRVGERGPQPPLRPETIAAAALARKLLVALWRYLATGLVPDGAGLKG